MKSDLYDFVDYKEYLIWREQTWEARGLRKDLARAMDCQPAYVSQVLNGAGHFSLEQAEKANHFLAHSREQAHYFLLLVQSARSGTPQLRQYFDDQIHSIQQQRQHLKNRVGVGQALKSDDQLIYYSSWKYAAIHVALTIESLRSPAKIAERLKLSREVVTDALEFLVRAGLAVKTPKGFDIGAARIHLAGDSKLISKHHINWRVASIRQLDEVAPANLHYSSVVSMAKDDADRLRELLIKAIERGKAIVRDSPAEDLYCFDLDFFRL